MGAGAFLIRGLAWGVLGLSLLVRGRPEGPAVWIVSMGWLAGLAVIGWMTARGSPKTAHAGWLTWGFMGVYGLLLALTTTAVR